MLLAVDPGADAGWARFDGAQLLACGLVDGFMDSRISRVIIEKPVIYPGGKQQARPADVIKLAVRAGEWGGLCRAFFNLEPEYVEPRTWKGSIKKEAHHPRIWAKLRLLEQELVAKAAQGIAPSKRHNILDAVGIGLYAVGRRA